MATATRDVGVRIDSQVVACVTQEKGSWRLLNEAVAQARVRGAMLRLVICQSSMGNSRDDFFHYLGKLKHAAHQACDENGLPLTIETLDCGSNETVEVEKLIKASRTDLVVMSDVDTDNKLLRWLPRKTDRIAKNTSCSVMLVR